MTTDMQQLGRLTGQRRRTKVQWRMVVVYAALIFSTAMAIWGPSGGGAAVLALVCAACACIDMWVRGRA